MTPANPQWRKSSYSRANDACVEVAPNLPDAVAIRDSKRPFSPILLIPRKAFHALTHP